MLEARGVCKSYGDLRANDNIHLVVRAGEKHALIGENGAGKSTLVNIIYGAAQADSGEIRWRGEPASINSPQAARKLGVGVIFQHFALFESMTVAENIRLGLDARAYQTSGDESEMRRLSGKYRLHINPARRIAELSVGEKQRVEILRCLLQEPQLLILDEPTSVLTPAEARALFELLEQLADEGRGVLFISHKLHEVEALCDKATVLRGGRSVFECKVADTNRDELIRKMVGVGDEEDGDSPRLPSFPRRRESLRTPGAQEIPACAGMTGESAEVTERKDDVLFQLRDVDLPAQNVGGDRLRVGELALKKGVITGVAGIAGNGQDELLNVVSGERIAPCANVVFNKQQIGEWGVAQRVAAGVLTIPTERHGRAAVGEMTLAENALFCRSDSDTLLQNGIINLRAAAESARAIINRFEVAAEGARAAAASLSGGNLQKFIVGRALMQNPPVLAAANPTWGVDVRAAAFIHRQITKLRDNGAAVLIISEDLDELFSLCDEIAVINRGMLSAATLVSQTGLEDVGRKMAEAA